MTRDPKWASTPAALRHRIATGWTLPRELVAAVRARAEVECRPASVIAEEGMRLRRDDDRVCRVRSVLLGAWVRQHTNGRPRAKRGPQTALTFYESAGLFAGTK